MRFAQVRLSIWKANSGSLECRFRAFMPKNPIYGDGVNVAARLQSLAAPGGICISRTVHDQIGNKLPLAYEDLGEQTVKNIAKPVWVIRVVQTVKHRAQ